MRQSTPRCTSMSTRPVEQRLDELRARTRGRAGARGSPPYDTTTEWSSTWSSTSRSAFRWGSRTSATASAVVISTRSRSRPGDVGAVDQLLELHEEVADPRRERHRPDLPALPASVLRPLLERCRPPVSSSRQRDEVMGATVPAGRGEAWLSGSGRAVPQIALVARPSRGTAMPTKAPADSAQQQRKSAVIDDITTRLQTADASVLTEYRGLTVTDLAQPARRAPARGDRLQGLQEHARPPGRGRRRLRRDGRAARGPGGDRLRAPRGRRGDRGQGAARLRQDEPEPRREGRDARAAGADRRRRRGPRRRAAPRRAAGPPRRRLPGPAREGGRPVPGLHPQLRLRPEGAASTRCPHGGVAARDRRRPRPRPRPQPSPTAEAETAETPEPSARTGDRGSTRPKRQQEKRTDGNDEQRGPARGLQEHDRARAERVPQGVRRGVRRHGGRSGRGRGGRWWRRPAAPRPPRRRTSST